MGSQVIRTDAGVLLLIEGIGGRQLTPAMVEEAFVEALARLPGAAEEPDNRGGGQETGVMKQPNREVKPVAADPNPETLSKKWAEEMFSASCRTLGRSKTMARLRRTATAEPQRHGGGQEETLPIAAVYPGKRRPLVLLLGAIALCISKVVSFFRGTTNELRC
jgi:hypothetical protein